MICGRDKGGFPCIRICLFFLCNEEVDCFYIDHVLYVLKAGLYNVLNMPLELLFETSLARAMTNLETYHSQGLLLVNLFGDVPPERIRKSVFFQPAVFRPGL